MQEQLDKTIHYQHNRDYATTLQERILALLVEMGELANETRCFKYWSVKEASPAAVIMEEYSDGIHFLLSLGIHFKANYAHVFVPILFEESLTKAFIFLFSQITQFSFNPTLSHYYTLMNYYLGLGVLLKINEEALKAAYITKNKVNFERQKNNY